VMSSRMTFMPFIQGSLTIYITQLRQYSIVKPGQKLS
jgi:hypothetical protein